MRPMLRSSLGSRCFALAGMRQSEGSAGGANTGEAPLMATAKPAQPTGRIGLLHLAWAEHNSLPFAGVTLLRQTLTRFDYLTVVRQGHTAGVDGPLLDLRGVAVPFAVKRTRRTLSLTGHPPGSC